MKNRIQGTIFLFLSVFFITSCGIQKKKYSKGFYLPKQNNSVASFNAVVELDKPCKIPIFSKKDTNLTGTNDNLNSDSILILEKYKVSHAHLTDTLCDVIVFKDLKEVRCIVKEINPEIIKYTKCGFETGPVVTVRRDKVSSIFYRNGESENFSTEQDVELKIANKPKVPSKKVEPLGVAALLIGVGAWLLPVELIVIAALVIGLSIIFGFVSLSRYTKEPEKYHGKIFPILALIAGLISVIALSYWVI